MWHQAIGVSKKNEKKIKKMCYPLVQEIPKTSIAQRKFDI
jgi:hypothetical protein